MSETTDLIAELDERAAKYGGGPEADRLYRAAAALEQAERDLTELGAAFRDYKIVHPEGTEDLHRKLAEQAAVIEAVREWWSITLWAQPDWPSLMAIIYPTEGTR